MTLLLGNEALAQGAIAGGARFLASYPLPGSAEIDLTLARELPERGGSAVFVEDEEAALAAVLGAGAGGTLGVTATTGAGLGRSGGLLAYGSETGIPALFAVVGSRVETPAREESAGQGEFAQLRWTWPGGARGCVYAPASPPECFSLARAGAALARRERIPVLLYVDDVVAHLREPVGGEDGPAPDADADGPAAVDLYRARDATVLVVAVGIVARAARTAVRLARDRGVRAGLLRPVRLWPFPEAELLEQASRCRTLVVAELNEGQCTETVQALLAARSLKIKSLADPRIGMWTPTAILGALMEEA